MNSEKLGKSTEAALTALLDTIEHEHGFKNGRTACYWHLRATILNHTGIEHSPLAREQLERFRKMAEERGWKSL